MSTRAKLSLADIAMQLRDEQLKARVVHYKQELETSPELDLVTAQIVEELRALQRAAGMEIEASRGGPKARDEIEIELISSLKAMLLRLFRPEKVSSFVERKMAEATKRFARLFFESELHDKIRGAATETRTMRFAEQAVYHAFAKVEGAMGEALRGFEYESGDILEQAEERYDLLVKELRNAFLSRTTPELNQLVRLLNEVLLAFFTKELPPQAGELAWEVIRESRAADAAVRAGYKISADAFPAFRQAFEKRFLQRLVSYAEDELLSRIRGQEKFRVETIHFVADPQIFSDICELICDAAYDFLYNDGFLDLPQGWRRAQSA